MQPLCTAAELYFPVSVNCNTCACAKACEMTCPIVSLSPTLYLHNGLL